MPADKNKISIVVPVHNGGLGFADCLASLVRQTRPADELIIVDNSSTDQTKEIIMSFAGRYPNIRYLFEGRLGRGQARNTGLYSARGDIIAMTDADCVVPEDWIERLTDPIENCRETIVMGFETDGVNNYWSRHRQAAEFKFLHSKAKDGYIDFLDTKNFAIRSDVLKDLGFNPDLIACEDLDLFLRLKQKKIAIRFLSEIMVQHQHVSSWRKLATTQFTYGRYSEDIIRNYRSDHTLDAYMPIVNDPHHGPGRRFLSWLMWSVSEVVNQPTAAPYTLTENLAWRIGALYSKIKHFVSNIKRRSDARGR